MKSAFDDRFAEYAALLAMQTFDPRSIDYSHLERHIGFLRQLAIVENSSLAVMDLFQRKYVFFQSKFLPVLGLELHDILEEGPRALFAIMHPDDVPVVIQTLTRGTEFIIALPAGEKKDYKIIYDFRLRSVDGGYVRFIQQVVPLELDRDGNIWLMLMVNDVITPRNAADPPQRKVVNVKTGRLHVFQGEEGRSRSILTKREIEILGMLSKGLGSKQVADGLFLSVNTVNNHRRNILEKTNAENTAEAIRYAMSLGLI